MVDSVWKRLGSPDLSPYTITLHAWDGHPTQPLGLYQKFPITFVGKRVMINMEVIESPLDYNLLLGLIYTYSMSIVASSVFCKMCFPHNGNIIIVDQLTSPHNTILLMAGNNDTTVVTSISPRVYKYSMFLGIYYGPLPIPSEPISSSFYMLQAS